ncbi:MAG: hypothetical protein ACKOET_19255 [Verrucomicrobiota bacterium]
MSARQWSLAAAFLVLGGLYVAFFTDWLNPAPIEIVPQIRDMPPPRARMPGRLPPDFQPVVFALDGKYSLTSIKVIRDDSTNKYVGVMWHVVADRRIEPAKAVLYGRVPRGMRAFEEGKKVQKLEPGVKYRLELEAGRRKGSVVFQTHQPVEAREP